MESIKKSALGTETAEQLETDSKWNFVIPHGSGLAWSILFISLVFTAIAWHLSNRYIRERAADRFEFRTAEMRSAIGQRMLEYEQVLRGGVGLIKASDRVAREEWHKYFENFSYQKHYPGIQGVGLSRMVSADQKSAFVEEIRADGFPEFNIRPEGERDMYTAIVYLDPFDWRNQRAFGFDMYSEATRRAAMDAAITTGEPAISGTVKLVQETDTDVQRGFLMYLPVFQRGELSDTPEQRRSAVFGFVYAVFRANDLMTGIRKTDFPDIEFEVFDGENSSVDSLVYDSDDELSLDFQSSDADFTAKMPLVLGGRPWTLYFESQDNFISNGESAISLAVACGGLLVDVLLFLVIGSIGREKRNALKIAKNMTREFHKARQRFQAVCDTAHDPIVLVDQSQKVVYANPSTATAFRLPANTLTGMHISKLFDEQFDSRRLLSPTPLGEERKCVRADGETFPATLSISSWNDGASDFSAIVIRDITEQQHNQALLQKHIQELNRSNRDLNDFAYIASHDLRSPLRNIDHLANWVIEDAGDSLPPESKNHLQILKARIGSMDQMLNDLLQYSRAGQLKFDLTDVDTCLLTRDIVSMLAKPATMQISIDDHLPKIHTLKTPLETCLRNLINNAIKHHDRQDGAVTISASTVSDEKFVRFFVDDDGPGIAPMHQAKIFKIFQTLAPKDDASDSSGIGLAIIKKTVETFGGEISLVSELGKGTRFILDWPKSIELLSKEDSDPTV